MLADVDWSQVDLGGAFILGAAGGSLATLRVMRYVFGYVHPDQEPPRRPGRRPEEPPEEPGEA